MNRVFCMQMLRSPLAIGALVVIAAASFTASSRAELTVVDNADGHTGLTVFKMTVTPAAAPVPAFKYRLLPLENDLRPGNAALYYCRAFSESGLSSIWKGIYKDFGEEEVEGGEKTEAWYSADRPLSTVPLDKMHQAAARFDTMVSQFVSRGTLREKCHWGHNLDELRGLDIVGLLLPELQETRSLSRALMLRARVAIADGDYDRAIDHLRMNYRLGQNAASDPILISGLVGIAECGLSNYELIELIAAKKSPNMYWALASMPHPLIDVRAATRYELNWGMKIFPVLADAEKSEHSPEEWARLMSQGLSDAQVALSLINGNQTPEPTLARLQMTGLALVAYADAKQRLIAGGMDAGRVEAMPVGQAIAVDAAREFRRIGDEVEKGFYVPYAQVKKYDRSEDLFGGNKLAGGVGRMLGQLLLPAISSVRVAQMRIEWQMQAIQTIEAIRLHAAETGKLPGKLDDITVVPVPQNPVTGKSYNYQVNGDTAVLELPFSDGFPDVAWRFEIKLAK